jgi:3-phosphoshikimate 1-carboxyvinyltransferase
LPAIFYPKRLNTGKVKTITIHKKESTLQGKVQLPFSKSESNRALILKVLHGQSVMVHNLSDAEDTIQLNRCLRMIDTCGASGLPMVVDVNNAGTAMRFLTAYLAILPGKWFLTGCNRMQERPVLALVNALKQIGAEIEYSNNRGFPPLLIKGSNLKGGHIKLDASISSQFISALLMIAPTLEYGLKLSLEGNFISQPYVVMTLSMLKEFGINAEYSEREIIVPPQEFKNNLFSVSPDWSAASYVYEIAALSESAELLIYGLKEDSFQGDRVVTKIYEKLGIQSKFTEEGLLLTKTGDVVDFFEYNFVDCPDLAQAALATCVGLGIEGKFIGLQSLKIKETDRVAKMNDEFEIFGYSLTEKNSEWFLKKEKEVNYEKVDRLFLSYEDHRMAMSIAPLVLKTGIMKIENPDVVVKSFPSYWKMLEALGFKLELN